jgi:hypothetical protein
MELQMKTASKSIEPPVIAFERFERDNDYNKNCRAKGRNRDIIYDFKVLVDGEWRAIWSRIFSGKGYELRDPDHRPIKERPPEGRSWTTYAVTVARQAEFANCIERCLIEDLIPTLDEMARLRLIEEALKEHHKRIQAEQDRVHRIELAAVPLYQIAIAIRAAYDQGLIRFDFPACPLVDGLTNAINLAEGKETL